MSGKVSVADFVGYFVERGVEGRTLNVQPNIPPLTKKFLLKSTCPQITLDGGKKSMNVSTRHTIFLGARCRRVSVSCLLSLALSAMGAGGCCLANRDASRLHPVVPFLQDGLYGFRDSAGSIAIRPRYYYASGFNEGLARVVTNVTDRSVGHKWVFIDEHGSVAIPRAYDEARDFQDGRAWVMVTNCVILIDKRGNELSVGQWSGAQSFSEGLAAVNEGGVWEGVGGKWGYVSLDGSCIISPRFTWAGRFMTGLAIVAVGGSWQDGGGLFLSNAKYGIINKRGEYVVLPRWKAIVRDASKNGFELHLGDGMKTWIDARESEFERANQLAARPSI